jgi:hypothetical protein
MSAEMEADIAFLLLRAGCAGSCSFSSDRWTGQSSNSLVALAYGGKQAAMPWDRSDYAAYVRTVRRLPKHRRTAAVMAGLRAAREHYLILTKPEELQVWMTAPADEAMKLQRPLPNGALKIAARGKKKDEAPSL